MNTYDLLTVYEEEKAWKARGEIQGNRTYPHGFRVDDLIAFLQEETKVPIELIKKTAKTGKEQGAVIYLSRDGSTLFWDSFCEGDSCSVEIPSGRGQKGSAIASFHTHPSGSPYISEFSGGDLVSLLCEVGQSFSCIGYLDKNEKQHIKCIDKYELLANQDLADIKISNCIKKLFTTVFDEELEQDSPETKKRNEAHPNPLA